MNKPLRYIFLTLLIPKRNERNELVHSRMSIGKAWFHTPRLCRGTRSRLSDSVSRALPWGMIPFIISALFISLSCSRNAEEPELKPLTLSEISGDVLWGRITADSDYRNYAEWPAHAGLQPGQSPHGVWHRVHGNRTLFDVLPLPEAIAPEGSIVVKENFDNNKELRNLTVMAKIEGYDPDNGDWFWAMYQPDGTVLTEGSPGGCISCHEGMRKNDFVIISPLDE